MPLTRPALILIALMALSACGGGTIWYAEGVTVATRATDLGRCEARALRQFPVRQELRLTPQRFIPASRTCQPDGTCTLIPARFEGGRPYTVDGNERARELAANACMAERGYAEIRLPGCEDGAAVRASTRMPPLTAQSCLLRNAGPGPLVANPL